MNLRLFAAAAAAVATFALFSCKESSPAYMNPGLSAERRTSDLLSRMTLEEKVGQLVCPLGWPMYEKDENGEVSVSEKYVEFIEKTHGGMLWATFRADPWTKKTIANGLDPALAARTYNMMQKYAIEHSRLGIPIILAEESPHGHMAIGTTVFPTGIGLASTWDPELLSEVGRVTAEELRAQGAHIGYGPVIDLAREPRWSRVEETYGEDAWLTSTLAAGYLAGCSPSHVGWDKGIIATLKHFVAYGAPEGGHNGNPSAMPARDLWEQVLPTFRTAVDSGSLSLMTSYNSFDGVPATSNKLLLTDVLRDSWKFNGFVVSDLSSVDGLAGSHRVAAGPQEAAEMALSAGVDVDLGGRCFAMLTKSVEEGKISEELIDRAAGRVLRLKFELGLFDNPYVDEAGTASVRSDGHREVALKAALEGVTLLENNGILPLGRKMRVAVVGPDADVPYNQLGDYTAPQAEGVVKTPLAGIIAEAGSFRVRYAKGCAVRDVNSSDIPSAVAAARASDVVVAVVGGSSARDFRTEYIETGAASVSNDSVSDMDCGEGFDRASLDLLGRQMDLLKALKATGKPLVVVYIQGRPLDMKWAKENADALITQWYPGMEGGTALAKVLYGDYNPAGRLPVSVPGDVGALPVYYNHRMPRRGKYVEMPSRALYPFGYGLSYTTFEYSGLKVEKTGPEEAEVTVTVTNTGSRDGDEVAQVYITDMLASTVRPVKQLCAYERVFIPAGGSKTLTFHLDRRAFSLYNAEMQEVVEPGEFTVAVGPSSEKLDLREIFSL